MKRLLVCLVLASTLSVAHAKPRKLSTAYAISGIGTGVSAALIVGAFGLPQHSGDIWMPMLWTGLATGVVTPSGGNWYAGKWLTVGMGIRVAAGGFAAYAASHYRQDHRCETGNATTCKEISNTGITLIGIAGLAFVGGAAYDFKTLQDDVDEYNAKHRFNWAPVLTPSPTGNGALLGIGGSF